MRSTRRLLVLLLTALLLVGVAACSAPGSATQPQTAQPVAAASSSPLFQTVSPEEAKAIIDKNEGNPNFVILDVRTPQEFQAGHIKGAINIDFYAPDFPQKLDRLDKGKVYVVYCRSGNRSAKTVALMKQQGFRVVYEIQGGVKAWQARGLPLVR